MQPDIELGEGNAWHWIIHGILASYVALLTWLGKGVFNDVQTLKKTDGLCKLELANFKTDVANTYSKDISVQYSLARIHDRLDSSQESTEENFKDFRSSAESNFKELREDIGEIKNLLICSVKS
jgi:hypothetical protein